MPLLAQEAARPPLAFQPALAPGAAEGGHAAPVPLLHKPSEDVLLHFQADASDRWTSPQVPQDAVREAALRSGFDAAALAAHTARLEALRRGLNYRAILAETPEEMLPSLDDAGHDDEQWYQQQLANAAVVSNAYGYAPPPQADVAADDANPNSAPSLANSNEGQQRQSGGYQAKGQNELFQRNCAVQAYVQQQVIEQRLNPALPQPLAAG